MMPPRRRTKDLELPRRMRRSSSGMLYYDHGPGPDGRRQWEPLSRDLREAKIKWARIEAERDDYPVRGKTVADILDYYRRRHLPSLGERTQHDRAPILDRLEKAFGHMQSDRVQPHHVAAYLEAHRSPVSANREIAVLSVAFRKAQRIGLCRHNPCTGVERNPERPRDRYITDEEFLAVKAVASHWMQAVMDLAYLTGMRQGDLLALTREQVRGNEIPLRQRKTRQQQNMEITAALRDVLSRIDGARKVAGFRVLTTRDGSPCTESGFKSMWQRTIRRAVKRGVIQERFTFHDIRAKAGTDAEERGLDPQRLLGHMDRRQTETYLRSRRPIRVQPLR